MRCLLLLRLLWWLDALFFFERVLLDVATMNKVFRLKAFSRRFFHSQMNILTEALTAQYDTLFLSN